MFLHTHFVSSRNTRRTFLLFILRASAIAQKHPELLKIMAKMYGDVSSQLHDDYMTAELAHFDHVDLLDVYKNAQQSIDDFVVG